MQIPIGEEDKFIGVIDLLRLKAFYFEGVMGSELREDEIPAEYLEEAKKFHSELIEKIVANDEAMMNDYLEGKEPAIEDLKRVLRVAVIKNEIFPET